VHSDSLRWRTRWTPLRVADLLEKRKKANPRAHVMGAYFGSHEKYGPLYKKLAE
jgi:hypothetical protein